jgi:peptidoglycan/xylan/chitin deacetylase (PgdA/CDA1 family)
MVKEDIAIMYHYVCSPKEWKGSVPIPPEQFEEQIIYFKKHYDIVSPDNMHIKTEKPKCLLTFDDATRDQYIYAFPILKKHGVPAYFAIMSGPLENGRVPTFHLVHAVLSHFLDSELWTELKFIYPDLDITKAGEFYYYESNLSRRYFKYALNFILEEEEARRYLIQKVLEVYSDLQEFIKQMYIQPNELREMYEAGMTLGVHCVNHLPYNSPPEKFYKEEIEPCIRYMQQQLNITPRWYTPAFGGGEKYQEMKRDIECLLKLSFKGVFTVKSGMLYQNGGYWLSRLDCNKIQLEKGKE